MCWVQQQGCKVTCVALQVRSRAQTVLFTALGTYNFCCRDLIPRVLDFLQPARSDISQQQFKVAEEYSSEAPL